MNKSQENLVPLVSIICDVYNHGAYLRQCLDGLISQKTKFPIEILIHDDASTDNSQEIIIEYCQKYPSLFKPILQKENQYSKGVKIWQSIQIPRANGKYIAFCEGDDYWIDPLKLQKQVDSIISHPNTYLVYTDYMTVNSLGESIFRKEYENIYKRYSSSGDILPKLFINNFPITCTILTKREIFEYKLYREAPANLDYLLCMTAAFLGDSQYLTDKTACYRMNPTSLMNTQQEKITKIYNQLHPYFAIEYAKGNVKKESFINDYKIKKTILMRFCHNQKIHNELFKTNKSFYFLWLWIKVCNYISYRLHLYK